MTKTNTSFNAVGGTIVAFETLKAGDQMRGSPMLCNRSYTFVWVVVLMTILGTNASGQELVRLSLDPYAARLENGASLISSGFDAPIRLPANQSTPSFALGFTIPNDYKPNTVIRVVILWESPATQCNFVLRPNFLFRARDAHPRGSGDASGGLTPVRASTPFIVTERTITMAAPDTAHQTASVRFRITTTPVEFPTLRQGDAVNFGIFRDTVGLPGSDDIDFPVDTCNDELGIAGISIVYNKKPPGASEITEASPED
jgi:hypothetical protein